jgi:hypothetical protein
MYSFQETAMLVETQLNNELKRQRVNGSISLYSFGKEVSFFYELNGSRYFFFFPLQIDLNRKIYKNEYPFTIDLDGIVKYISQKVKKIDTSYIV